MEFSGALQLLETDGVPGAQLLMDRLELYHNDDLKRWLKCRALKLDGNKTDLIQRYIKTACFYRDTFLMSTSNTISLC